MSETIRVLIADDHAVVREGLRGLISSEPGMEVVAEARDGLETVQRVRAVQPDVILVDLVMPRMDGIQAIGEITDDDKVFPAIKAGALGYLLKDSSPQELLDAIREVYHGESSLHPTIARKLIRELSEPPNLPPADEPLTEREPEREVEVLRLVAQGLSNEEIGNRLFISERTVRTHVSNILGKLHLANRTQAALYALREGLATLD